MPIRESTLISCLAAALLLPGAALAQRSVTIHVQGSQPGKQVLVQAVDLQARQILYEVVKVCQPEVFQLPHDGRFLLIIRDWDSMLLLHQDWERDSGPLSLNPTIPTATGHCGDGLVTGAEVCDIKGNVGCPPTKPACLNCGDCGCFATIHCPQPSPSVGSCGWGRCAPDERPHFSPVCAWGACLFRYDCRQHLECVMTPCAPDSDTQQSCEDTCAAPGACFYDTTTMCWTCRDPATVPNPCADPADSGCLLDPALVGLTADSAAMTDTAELLDHFSIDELTEEEGRVVMSAEGDLVPPMWTLEFLDPQTLSWREGAYDSFNVYRGDLELLLADGYSQDPGSNPLAARFCDLPGPPLSDPLPGLLPNEVAFYLFTAVFELDENGMGFTNAGAPRTNTQPCP